MEASTADQTSKINHGYFLDRVKKHALDVVINDFSDSMVFHDVNYIKRVDKMINILEDEMDVSTIQREKILIAHYLQFLGLSDEENFIHCNDPKTFFITCHDKSSLLRADSIDGIYTTVVDSIHQGYRSYEYEMEFSTNYLRLEAISRSGQTTSSTPVFVMGIDTIAPATPTVIGATIDSTGRIKIAWNANSESDLWGYRLYKGNYADQELSLVNATPTLDTVYVDSTHLDLGIDKVYYRLTASDERNNTSDFTDFIVIEKPDIIPPVAAVINKIVQKSDSLLIHWTPSPSDDVASYSIFRRAIDHEQAWTLIDLLPKEKVKTPYVDIDLDYDRKYAYTISCVDSSANATPPCSPVIYLYKAPKEEFTAIKEIDIAYDDKNKLAKLSWECNEEENIEKYVLYKGKAEKRLSRYKIIAASENSFEEAITEDNTAVYYKLKPVYSNRNSNFISELLTVETK